MFPVKLPLFACGSSVELNAISEITEAKTINITIKTIVDLFFTMSLEPYFQTNNFNK